MRRPGQSNEREYQLPKADSECVARLGYCNGGACGFVAEGPGLSNQTSHPHLPTQADIPPIPTNSIRHLVQTYQFEHDVQLTPTNSKCTLTNPTSVRRGGGHSLLLSLLSSWLRQRSFALRGSPPQSCVMRIAHCATGIGVGRRGGMGSVLST